MATAARAAWAVPHQGLPGAVQPDTDGGREWWAAFMSEDQYVSLVREIEAHKGSLSAHERVCAERYKGLDEKISDLQSGLNKVVDAVTSTGTTTGVWKERILYATIAALFSFACWAGGQLWNHDVAHPALAVAK